MKYDFTAIEKKWQEKWLEEKPFTAVTGDKTREKFYGLIEFPYPSGQGLHVGHARPFTAMDIICRKKRMKRQKKTKKKRILKTKNSMMISKKEVPSRGLPTADF